MKISIEREVLAEAVAWVARALPSRPPSPVLLGVLIEANDDQSVTLSAFDYEISARTTIEAEVSEAGTVLVQGRLLNDICRSLPNRPVDLTTEGSKLDVRCGASRFSLGQMPAGDYPSLPTAPEPTGTIDGTLFTQAVQQVQIAADKGDTLPILTGVRVEIEGEKMSLLATDRYRLAMRELTWRPSDAGVEAVALIPARQLSDTAKSLGAAGPVDIAIGGAAGGDGLVGFEAGSRRTTTRLLDGEYPKVASIFPSSSDTEAVIETAALVEAVKRVSLVLERNSPVRLAFTDGQLSIVGASADDAQATEALECTLTGPEIEIGFNPHFLLDGLAAVGTPLTRLQFTQPSRPAVLVGQAEPDAAPDMSYRYVLMPVRYTS